MFAGCAVNARSSRIWAANVTNCPQQAATRAAAVDQLEVGGHKIGSSHGDQETASIVMPEGSLGILLGDESRRSIDRCPS